MAKRARRPGPLPLRFMRGALVGLAFTPFPLI